MEKQIELYHATEQQHIAAIAKNGLNAGTCFGTDDICAYYAEDMTSAVTLMLKVTPEKLESDFELDSPSLEEPITTVLGASEEDIFEAWEDSAQTNMDALEITGAVRSLNVIPSTELVVVTDHDEIALPDYAQRLTQDEA